VTSIIDLVMQYSLRDLLLSQNPSVIPASCLQLRKQALFPLSCHSESKLESQVGLRDYIHQIDTPMLLKTKIEQSKAGYRR